MSLIVEFLEARMTEDEAVAKAALHSDAIQAGEWAAEHHNSEFHAEPNRCHIAEDRKGHYWSVADEVFIPNAEHIARHDPARALREVAAKRAIIKAYSEADDRANAYNFHETLLNGESNGLELAVELLASAYSTHADYQTSWG